MVNVFVPHLLRIHSAALLAHEGYTPDRWSYQQSVPRVGESLRDAYDFAPSDVVDYFAGCAGDYASALKARHIHDASIEMVRVARQKREARGGGNWKVFKANSAFVRFGRQPPDHVASFEPYDLHLTAFPIVLLSAIASVRKSLTVAYRSDHRFGVPAKPYEQMAKIYGAHFVHFHASVNVEHQLEGHEVKLAGLQQHCFFRITPTEVVRKKAGLDLTVIDALNKLVLTPLAGSGKERKAFLKIVAREFVDARKTEDSTHLENQMENQLELFLPGHGSIDVGQLRAHLNQKGTVVSLKDLKDSLSRISRLSCFVNPRLVGEVQVRKAE